MMISVKVRCVQCKATRNIKAGEVAPGDHPMCTQCYMPMVPSEARAKKGESKRVKKKGSR
jgi:hypothetical protein